MKINYYKFVKINHKLQMRKIYSVLVVIGLVLFFVDAGNAQISQGGKPLSFNSENAAILATNVPTAVMPFVDMAALQEEDLVVDKIKEIPWRFGQNLDVILNPSNSGINEVLPNGDKLWRLRIYSQGATSINLTFDNYLLPPGAKLFIYNDDHSDVIGAFTDFNNQEDRVFATTLVKGSAITLEYYEPADAAFSGELNLSRVTHGYRGIKEYLKDFGTAGTCQVNVHCATGTGWEDQIKSVCMLVTGGAGFCTGALVNNTANDGTPYILTANHCYSTPTTWVFWFNWEAPTCTQPTSSPSYNSISGATLKAKNAGSDFCLVQMSSPPPANYNVIYTGWDRTGVAPTSGMAIHHPDCDIKKISPCSAMTASTYSSASCWKTPWSTTACTEPGSSGSPIFDQNKRLVGQLYGGPSACGASAANMNDYYGRFDVSWTGGGTSATRLSNWLDPSSTGVTVIDLYNPNGAAAPTVNFVANVTSSCVGSITFTDQSTNTPTSWYWTFGDGATSTAQNPTHDYAANGTYSVTLQATNTIGPGSLTKTSYITINKPAGPVGAGATVCNPSTATLSATGSGTIKWYNSLASSTVLYTGNPYTTTSLSSTTTYYAEDNVTGSTTHVGKTDSVGGGSMFTTANVHYEVFNTYVPLVLQTVKIYANAVQTGKVISLMDHTGATLASATVNLVAGINTVMLNFSLPVDTGLRLVGPASPGWYRNTAGFSYPITTPGKFSIIRSSAGSTLRYYYFYDWVVKENDCISTRTAVTATVVSCTGTEEMESTQMLVSPNPVNNLLNIDFSRLDAASVQIEIFDLLGQRVFKQSIANPAENFRKSLDVSNLLNGIYFIRINTGQIQKTYKFQKI